MTELIAMITLLKTLGVSVAGIMEAIIIFLVLFGFIFTSQLILANKFAKSLKEQVKVIAEEMKKERNEQVDKIVEAIGTHNSRLTVVETDMVLVKEALGIKSQATIILKDKTEIKT